MNQSQSNRTSSNLNQDAIAASLVAALKQHIVDIESELLSARRELNVAKETLQKLERIIGVSERISSATEPSPPLRPTTRLIEPISPHPIAVGGLLTAPSSTSLSPIAQRVRGFTDKALKWLGIEDDAGADTGADATAI